jgi:hypothetical protein
MAVASGLALLWTQENVPGVRLPVPVSWPAASRISRASGVATLVLFAHPRCPCTRATLAELARLLALYGRQVRTHVIFYTPPSTGEDWAHTALWSAATAIPGVEVACDHNGAEAALFGATTSGFVLLYDAGGTLRFNGGITAERAHEGPNDGIRAIVAILTGQTPARTVMPVLGCSILGSQSRCATGPIAKIK